VLPDHGHRTLVMPLTAAQPFTPVALLEVLESQELVGPRLTVLVVMVGLACVFGGLRDGPFIVLPHPTVLEKRLLFSHCHNSRR